MKPTDHVRKWADIKKKYLAKKKVDEAVNKILEELDKVPTK